MTAGKEVRILHRKLELSNLDKILYPESGFSKAHVLDYYRRVSPWLLPHLRLRPLTLKRYPDGVRAGHFFEKNCPKYRPDWMQTARHVAHTDGRAVRYCLVNDLPSLMWVANLASLELHVLQSRSVAPDRPTAVVFDLDPGPPAGLIEAAKVGLLLQRVLADIGLASFAKVSGGKGLHCCVPLNTPYDYTQSKEFAKTVAKRIEAHYPELVTSRMNKKYRTGKVFIDWSQNDEHKSTVCAYSLRATPKPYVAAPVSWDEVDLAVQHNQEDALRFTPEQVMDRLAGSGDLLAPVLYRRQRLPGLKPREIEPVRVLNYSEEAASHADIAGGLAEYRGKRRFEVTPEPAGTGGNQDKWRSSFVVQKHSAGRLHYDLRLECDGVLKSWAVPKGPSFDPGQRRLAVRTEDHPLAYAGFEGRIPKGQYGAGQVIVWDRGAYSPAGSPDPDEANVSQALEEGKLEVTLQGAKLQGDFVLVRTGRDQQGKEQWLLIKKKDAVANSQVDPLQAEPYSVLSGLWIEDLEDASGSSCETSP